MDLAHSLGALAGIIRANKRLARSECSARRGTAPGFSRRGVRRAAAVRPSRLLRDAAGPSSVLRTISFAKGETDDNLDVRRLSSSRGNG